MQSLTDRAVTGMFDGVHKLSKRTTDIIVTVFRNVPIMACMLKITTVK